MFRVGSLYKSFCYLVVFVALASSSLAQKTTKKGNLQGTPVLWQAVNVSRQNLILGPGGEEMRPDLSRITFIERDKSGSNLKYKIKDGAGRTWVAKIGKEAQSETSAVRLVWALGYKSEVNYYVPTLTIPGKGTFKDVRLEARPDNIKRLDNWKWKKNPFIGTRELKGLAVLMALINNWDIKDDNNKILFVEDNNERQYIVSDLGATFGKIGNLPLFWRLQRSRNVPSDYAKTKFIKKVKNGRIEFSYHGKMRELFKNVTVEDVRWITNLLAQLRDDQIRDAFRAANYSSSDVELLSEEVRNRITQLKDTVGLIKVRVQN